MQIIYILKTLISFAFSHFCISHFIFSYTYKVRNFFAFLFCILYIVQFALSHFRISHFIRALYVTIPQ